MIEILVIPMVTTILTTIVFYIKENKQGKIIFKKTITEQKLKELYNDLFSFSLIYSDMLEKSFYVTPSGMFEVEGKTVPEEDTEMIKDIEIWDELIIKIRELIHGKLHLLEEDDLSKWHQIELMELEDKYSETINIAKYRQLEEFLIEVTIKYKKLYKTFYKS